MILVLPKLFLLLSTFNLFSSYPSLIDGSGYYNIPENVKPRHVIILLKDQSVSEVRASLKRMADPYEDEAIVTNLKEKQDTLRGEINMCGGTVIQQYQYALNGVRVEITSENEDLLRSLPDVLDIIPVGYHTRAHVQSLPFLGVPSIWNSAGKFLGENIKVGIIDDGIDYTHANFGGVGTVAAYNAANASSTSAADPRWFGPNAPKIKGGFDFAGDSYDGTNTPIPDSNPLDCSGHGTHVAGTVGGFGVLRNNLRYTGPYDENTFKADIFSIGPGVAPMADLYAYRVFGCSGSTDLIVDAIDRAMQDDMDVINLSLGTEFGTNDDADIRAVNNAVRAGIIVVASAGNEGGTPYITGSPASANGAISVAAINSDRSPQEIADFSSSGPRSGDSYLKPDISAPGVSILSAAVGTGFLGKSWEGTSMASPHVAGVAALVKQAHPTWFAVEVKAAIMSTAINSMPNYKPVLFGAGTISPPSAVSTDIFAYSDENFNPNTFGTVSINYGYVEIDSTLYTNARKTVILKNRGANTVTYDANVRQSADTKTHTMTLAPDSFTIDANAETVVRLTLQVPATTAFSTTFFDASGTIIFTPRNFGNRGIRLSLPYYIVPRSVSSVTASITSLDSRNLNIEVENTNGPVAGVRPVEFFAWGIHENECSNVRAVGVRSEGSPADPLITFAINTYTRWSAPYTYFNRDYGTYISSIIIFIDVDPQNCNGNDYEIVGLGGGTTRVRSLSPSSTYNVPFTDPRFNIATDSSVALFRIRSSMLCAPNEPCLSDTNPSFTYGVFDDNRNRGSFNPFVPSIQFTLTQIEPLNVGQSRTITVQVNSAEIINNPTLGVLVIAPDNKAGRDQALELLWPGSRSKKSKSKSKKASVCKSKKSKSKSKRVCKSKKSKSKSKKSKSKSMKSGKGSKEIDNIFSVGTNDSGGDSSKNVTGAAPVSNISSVPGGGNSIASSLKSSAITVSYSSAMSSIIIIMAFLGFVAL